MILSIFYNSSQKQPIISVDKIVEPGQVFTGELSLLILNMEVLQTEANNNHQQ